MNAGPFPGAETSRRLSDEELDRQSKALSQRARSTDDRTRDLATKADDLKRRLRKATK